MAVFCDVHDHRLSPAKQEVAHACTSCNGNAEVGVIGHEDQHQEVADDHLDDVEEGLQEVGGA